VSGPTVCGVARCHHDSSYCTRCDLLVGLDGLHVLSVDRDEDASLLGVVVESPPGQMGCHACGVVAHSHGRRDVVLIDAPCLDRPVRLIWRKRSWRCVEPMCPTKVCTEQDEDVALPRVLLTTGVSWSAINQIRREHASIFGIARQLGTTWNTVWSSIRPLLAAMAADESRVADVTGSGWTSMCGTTCPRCSIAGGGRGAEGTSEPRPSTRFAVGSNKSSTATAAARTTRSTASA